MTARSEEDPARSRLTENLTHFVQLLRRAGLPVGTSQLLSAISALDALGLQNRADFHTCLFSLFVQRIEQRAVFDQAFSLFWEQLPSANTFVNDLPGVPTPQAGSEALLRRLGEALTQRTRIEESEQGNLELDAAFSAAAGETLLDRDFEDMSAQELAEARALLRQMRFPLGEIRTRRFRAGNVSCGHLDRRASLRAALRNPNAIPLRFHKQRMQPPSLVLLCDISGSMSQYSRMLLHFMHTLTNVDFRVSSFVFATRLSNISRQLRHRDVDFAVNKAATTVKDWSGGTRIAACLRQFNRDWSRRVLTQGAVVLIISDGLDTGQAADLPQQMERLSKSCRKLIWLNPLLRFDDFQPRASGIRAMLPYVDEFRSAHNLRSLTELGEVLAEAPTNSWRQTGVRDSVAPKPFVPPGAVW